MNANELSAAIYYLKPNAEFSFVDADYSTIKWDVLEGDAPTLEELQTAHSAIEQAKAQERIEAQAKRQALLDKLGITEDEAKLLLGGN